MIPADRLAARDGPEHHKAHPQCTSAACRETHPCSHGHATFTIPLANRAWWPDQIDPLAVETSRITSMSPVCKASGRTCQLKLSRMFDLSIGAGILRRRDCCRGASAEVSIELEKKVEIDRKPSRG